MQLLGTYPILSLLPPVFTIGYALLTKRVFQSMLGGIGIGICLMAIDQSHNPFLYAWSIFSNVFYSSGEINENVSILVFLCLLGTLTLLMQKSGNLEVISGWVVSKVKSRRNAQLFMILFGVIVFIDDYFNSLAVGKVSRPIADRMGISRAKLAYILDSTAGPVCILAPISSWGASIIVILDQIVESHQLSGYNGFSLFLASMPYNFYAFVAIALVVLMAVYNVNFKKMAKAEKEALVCQKQDFLSDSDASGLVLLKLTMPLIMLFVSAFGMIALTGIMNAGEVSLLSAIENSKVGLSLVAGGLVSVLTQLFLEKDKKREIRELPRSLAGGFRVMWTANAILVLAWVLSGLTKDLQSGIFLAGLIEQSSISFQFLPVVIFVVAGFMSFSTGTSWGTFAIILPIAAQIAVASDPSLLTVLLAAVLGGSVFGDHCSPISDTTILSSTGAGCDHIQHVTTQLPYCLLAGLISLYGYFILSYVGNAFLALAFCLVTTWIGCALWGKRKNRQFCQSRLRFTQ